MKLKKFFGYLILSQVLCLVLFSMCLYSNGIDKILKDGIGLIWLFFEGMTALTIFVLFLTKKAFDWIEQN